MLTIIYSAGDSFGQSTKKGEIISAFSSYQKAEKAMNSYMKKIENDVITIPLETEKGILY